MAERRKRSIQEYEAAAKRRGDNAAVNVNGNVNDWFMIANLYDEAAENLEETLRAAMKNAGKMKIAEENNSTPRRYVIDESNGLYVSDEDIQAGIREVSQMESVSNISGEGFKKGEVDLTTQVAEFFKANGGVVANEQVGNIVMDRRSAKDDIAHGIGRKKAAAFAAVPDVLRSGKVIDFQENWKNRGYQTAVIAAPIEMDGERYLMGAVIRRESGDARFYVHEILTAKEGQTPFKTGTDSKTGGDPGGDYPSVISLLQKVKSVNSGDENSSTRYSMDEGAVSSIRKETQAEITKKYGKSVDNILAGKYGSQDNVLMGYTPNILQKLGVPDLPVVIGPGHVYSIAKTEAEAQADGRFRKGTNYHGMGEQTVKSLYEKLESPIAVIASKDIDTKRFPVRSQRSVVEIIDIGSKNKSLLAAVEITVDRRVQGTTMDVNVLSSAYERNAAGLLQEAIAQENSGDIGVFYIKKETAGMVADKGTIPNGTYHASVSGTILHQIPEKVNLRIQNQTQTKQFADWFGDWQNNPSRASKVVNEDGTPKVMYHGTSTGGFHVFDTYGSNFGLFGTGSYFTDNADVAQSYMQKGKGQNPQVYAVYLNIRNPIDMDANASIARWQKAAPDAADYFKGRKTNEDCFRALKEYCQDEMMYNYDAYDYIQGVIEDMGYDGITHIGGGRYNKSDGTRHRVYIAFHPEQVKSATDNVGTFDKNNPDIRYSLSDDTDETDLPGWDEDSSSKFDQFTDTYEKGTNLIGKSKSIQAAEELKREYGSRANIQSIAAKYRQMTTIAEQFSNVHLDGMMGEELLGKENRTRTYEETQLPTSNHAAVFHRLVIARAGCTTQKRQSIRTTAFNDAI